MTDLGIVERSSRLQFARCTALYHFLFVPLTLGLLLAAGGHGRHLRHDGQRIWRAMTR